MNKVLKKYLIVAHPDDEVLWFNPAEFDKIIIVFLEREDSLSITKARKRVLEKHPLKDRIICFGLKESNYWKDKTKEKEHKDNYDEFTRKLKGHLQSNMEIWTHNLWGEHEEHADHILVHQGVIELADKFHIPVYCYNGIDKIITSGIIKIQTDLVFFKELRQLYLKEGAWTWENTYIPEYYREYFQV